MDDTYTYILQGNYGGRAGWEDLTADDSYAGIKSSRKDYESNEPGTALRIVKRNDRTKRQAVIDF